MPAPVQRGSCQAGGPSTPYSGVSMRCVTEAMRAMANRQYMPSAQKYGLHHLPPHGDLRDAHRAVSTCRRLGRQFRPALH